MPETFEMRPRGPFDLAQQRRYFGEWLTFEPQPPAVAMAFPVEGWSTSAAVVLRQPDPDIVTGDVHGCDGALAKKAWEQALATVSLDVDGTDFPRIGERDPVMGRLQREHAFIRPTLFHSPYEAACNFVIGQRISQAQAHAIRLRMGSDSGDMVTTQGMPLPAFPRPQRLLEVTAVRGLSDEKLTRLHGIARAALEGVLERAHLRELPPQQALAEVSTLRGVGPFSAQGIVFRGAGVVDDVTDEPLSKQAVQRLYEMDHVPDHADMLRIADAWRPFRMWALVLLHVWIRGRRGGPSARQQRREPPSG